LTGPGASSLDAVERACRAIEADNRVHSVGRGGCPDRSGEVTLDASIMASPSRCGAVCYLRQFAHPVTVARRVMEKLPLVVLLAGDGADRFATRQGLTPANLLTARARATWQKWIMRHPSAAYRDDTAYPPPANLEESDALPEGESAPHNRYHDTVGVLAIDERGQMAGACSTSGLPFKVPGRVGDSPIIGQGLYVDPRRGAAVCTGVGELVMGVCGSFLAVESMGRGASPRDAARAVLERILESYELRGKRQVAVVALHPSGQWSAAALRPGYQTALRTAERDELVSPECVMLA
jgi:isoaspartyl peptidase/L-asparaginase-like protein (Ntn-hydrolase superfamily)